MTGYSYIAIFLAALLGLEWRYRLGSIRFVAVVVSLLVMWMSAPNISAATRRAFDTPPAERVTIQGGDDYLSGVLTMKRAVMEASRRRASQYQLGLVALTWLALTPWLRQGPPTIRKVRGAFTRWYREAD